MSGATAEVSCTATLRSAISQADMDAARHLLMSNDNSFDFNFLFEGFERELSSLPGSYSPPSGRLILAEIDGTVVGVVALRPLPAWRLRRSSARN